MEKISVDRLFRASKPITLADRQLIVRALLDYELREQHDEATLASLTTQRALRDPTSRLYQLRLATAVETASDDDLRALILFAVRQMATIEAMREYQPEYIELAENATEDERRDWQEARTTSWNKSDGLRKAHVTKQVDDWTAKIAPMGRDELVSNFKVKAITIQVDNDFARAYDTASLLFGVRNADGSPYFADMEEAGAVDDQVRDRLIRELRLVNDLDPLALNGTSSTGALPAPGTLPEKLEAPSGEETPSTPPGG